MTARKLHVSNLSPTIDDEDLDRLFTPYGTVRAAEIVADPRTGQSTGVGLVEMQSHAQGEAAIAALHGVKCCDRSLAVGWSTAEQETAARRPRMYTPMNTAPDAEANRARTARRLSPGPH